jgi:type VI secretion system protein ImpL
MKKFRIDLLSCVLASIVAGCLIWFKGDLFWLDSATSRALAIAALFALLVLLMLVLGFEPRRDEAAAARRLSNQLAQDPARLAGSTQALVARQGASAADSATTFDLTDLRDRLRAQHGRGWRYRQPWLLLTGDDTTIGRLLPQLGERGWLATPDAVLLWRKPASENGQPDTAWLRQIHKLRRQVPIDAVILTTDGETNLPVRRTGVDAYVTGLSRIAEGLCWSAPIYLLDVAGTHAVRLGNTPPIGCELAEPADAATIDKALQSLRNQLSDRSIDQLVRDPRDRYLGELSARLDTRVRMLADWLGGLAKSPRRRIPLRGIMFASYPIDDAANGPAIDLPLWQHLGQAARRHAGRRIGWHPVTVGAVAALTAIGLWSAGMLVSGVQNGRDIHAAQQAIDGLRSAPDSAARLHALLALQQQIERYVDRTEHHAPIATRFGLNRDATVLEALWKPYAQASRQWLTLPVQQDLEASLADLAQMRTNALDEETSRWALDGQQGLKTYLMLAHPERAEPEFLAPQLARHWSTDARLTPGAQQDLAERLFRFHAQYLPAHPGWRILPQPELVAGARQTLLAVIGERNAEGAIYQGMLRAFDGKYADQTLASLTAGTDARGLLRTAGIVPGVFTRQAYEGYVAAAIESAARRTAVASDWVLTDGRPEDAPQPAGRSPEALQAALTEQYFADYADHWRGFMNSMQWAQAPTLPAAIDQLKLMADARQSPVIALMKSLAYQGGAGARKDSLSDTLVARAQDLLGRKAAGAEAAQPDPAGPLGAAFGPVLRLTAQAPGTNDDLSLQRFLDRATALRLRLQQISHSADADAQARQMAQALFQGKASALADTQSYAQLVAASLGSEWAGMGEALFVRPIAQAMQTVLQPAKASLNAAWRQGIATAWGRSFAGRYPFADTANDASLTELARFLHPETGLLAAFLGTHLAGALELQGDQWVPVTPGGQTGGEVLAFDPAFLRAVNALQRVAAHMMAQSELQYRFEVKPIPSPGLTETVLTLDGQKLHYYNQRERWQAMRWPANTVEEPGARLQWQSEGAGTNRHYEFGGYWGWVRMLERASIEPLDSATYQLTWHGMPETRAAATGPDSADADAESLMARAAKRPPPADMVYPLKYLMRTDVGQGPLELLALRGFILPSRIFLGRAPHGLGRSVPATVPKG